MKNQNHVYYKNPSTFLEVMIDFYEDNRDIIQSRNLKESDLGELQEYIKENLHENHSLGELWSTCIYIKQWTR